MDNVRRSFPVISHLVLVALLILVWEKLPDGVKDLLATRLKEPPSASTASFIGYCVTAVAIVLLVFFFEWFSRRPFFAMWSKDRDLAKFEGIWAQKTSIERPFSIAVIQFNLRKVCWEYNGVGYNDDFTPGAVWYSTSQTYNSTERDWYFAGTARLLAKEHKDATFTVVPLLHTPHGAVDHLTGRVADIGAGGRRRIFDILTMRRAALPPDFAHHVATPDTMQALTPQQVRDILSKAQLM